MKKKLMKMREYYNKNNTLSLEFKGTSKFKNQFQDLNTRRVLHMMTRTDRHQTVGSICVENRKHFADAECNKQADSHKFEQR